MDFLDIVMELRKQYGIEVPEDDYPRLESLDSCAEYLVHAVDVEGLQTGIDLDLVQTLAAGSPLPVTYAGGANSLADLEAVQQASGGRVHLTIGSALDIFGGKLNYTDCVAYNRRHSEGACD